MAAAPAMVQTRGTLLVTATTSRVVRIRVMNALHRTPRRAAGRAPAMGAAAVSSTLTAPSVLITAAAEARLCPTLIVMPAVVINQRVRTVASTLAAGALVVIRAQMILTVRMVRIVLTMRARPTVVRPSGCRIVGPSMKTQRRL